MWTAHRRQWKKYRQALMAALAIPALGACSISDILSVDLPGVVAEEDLADATLADVLANGVIGDFECAWGNYVAAAAHHDDQRIPTSGNLNMREWGQRKMTITGLAGGLLATGSCASNYGVYTVLHTARFQAVDIFNRLEAFAIADVPNKVDLQGIVTAYGAYALVALGEGFCSMAVDGGAELTPAAVFALARDKFSEAITIATGTGNTAIVNMAHVGRARMLIGLQDWAAASTEAALVPAGFSLDASRGNEQGSRYNRINWFINGDASGRDFSRNASMADNYKVLTIRADGMPASYCDSFGGSVSPSPSCDGPEGAALLAGEVLDNRVNVTTANFQGFDFSTIHYFNAGKNNSQTAPMVIASWKEAQLYIAEAEAQLGNLDAAITVINGLRTGLTVPLPLYASPTAMTQTQVITAVLEERRRVLFDEAGHRLNDMLRYRGTAYNIPFLGEAGSLHPAGIDQNGDGYGSVTCFDLPLVETTGNQNI